jgi:tRNA nucleotidyltransferase (CCA-adding enzyme)
LRLAYLLNWLLPKKDILIQAEQIVKDFRYSKANTKDALFYLDLFLCNYKIETMNSIEIRKILSKVVAYTGIRQIEIILEGFLSYIEIFSEKNSFEQFKKTIYSILNSNNPLVLKELAVNGNQIIGKFPLLDKRKLGAILQSVLNRVLENPDENQEEKIYTYISEKMLDTNTV